MNDRSHALVVGGTGMLRGVVTGLHDRGWRTSVVARPGPRLEALCDAAPGLVAPIAADWREPAVLLDRLGSIAKTWGNPQLVVVWTHDSAAPLAAALGEWLAARPPARVIPVLGSSAADPRRVARDGWEVTLADALTAAGARPVWQPVVLGFVLDGDGARWLTHPEIAGGVLAAIDAAPRDEAARAPWVVGQVEPWSRRP